MRRGPPQVDVQRAQNERSDLSSSSRWKLRKTSSRRKLHAVPCRCTRMSCTAVLTASSLGGPLYWEPGLQLLPGKKPTLPCLTGRIRCCTDVLTEIPLGLRSNRIQPIQLLCPPGGPLCIFRHSQ